MGDEFATLKNLSEIFENKKFKIPDYQRSYSWEESQREDLLSDIESLLENKESEHKHFMGTLVLTKTNNKNEENTYEIVDGQQRITTLVILLKCYFDKIEDKESEDFKRFINRGDKNSYNFSLELNLDDINIFFEDLIYKNRTKEEKDCEYISQKNILKAYERFDSWLKDHNKDKIDEIYKIITKKLGFIVFAPEHNKEYGMMFEVINNRGKELSELEKIKNYLLYYASKVGDNRIIKEVNDNWSEIIKNLSEIELEIGKIDKSFENSFLRASWICFFDPSKKKSHHIYYNLKQQINIKSSSRDQNNNKLIDFIYFLVESSKYFKKFHISIQKNDLFMSIAKEISYQPLNASVLPLYIAITYRYNNKNYDSEKLINTLQTLEILNFRLYSLNNKKRSDFEQGRLFELAYKFTTEDKTPEDLFKELENIIIENSNIKEEDSEENLKEKIKSLLLKKHEIETEGFNFYNSWRGNLKYFLYRYEVYKNEGKTIEWEELTNYHDSIKNKKPMDFYSIEHILPQKKDEISLKDEEARKIEARLGNYTLLENKINPKASNNEIKEKINSYNDTNVLQTKCIIDIYNKIQNNKNKDGISEEDLYQGIIEKREEDMVKFVKEEWFDKLDKLRKEILS